MDIQDNNTPQPESKKFFLWTGLVLVVIGLGAGWYFVFGSPAPYGISAQSVSNSMQEVTSAEYVLSTDVEMLADDNPSNPLNFIVGDSATANPAVMTGATPGMGGASTTKATYKVNFQVSGALRFSATEDSGTTDGYWSNSSTEESNSGYTNISLGASKGSTSTPSELIELQTRNFGSTIYLNLQKFPAIPFISGFIQPFIGQWIEVDESAVGAISDLPTDEEDFNSIFSDNIQEITNRAREADIFSVVNTQEVTVNGKDVIQYEFNIDKGELGLFIRDVYSILAEDLPEDSLTDYETSLTSIEAELENITINSATVGVMKESQYIESISIDTVYASQEYGEIESVSTLSFKNYNQPVTVERPENTTTFEEIMNSFGAGGAFMQSSPQVQESMSEANSSRNDAMRQQDISQIRTALELCANYKGSYAECDTVAVLEDTYIIPYPSDPVTGENYPFRVSTDGFCVYVEKGNWEGDSIPANDSGCGGDYSLGPGV